MEKHFDDIVNRAIEYAKLKHNGQFRFDGEPYFMHPYRVLFYLNEYKKSSHSDILLEAAVLHDTLEDTDTKFEDINLLFGSKVAGLVLELTSEESVKRLLGKTEYLKLKLNNMSSWALAIKLCDRLDNVKSLEQCSESFKHKYVLETFKIMNFIINNRNLSQTHLHIILNILAVLKNYEYLIIKEDCIVDELTYSVLKLIK